jgi:Resolvase, N terminal domain
VVPSITFIRGGVPAAEAASRIRPFGRRYGRHPRLRTGVDRRSGCHRTDLRLTQAGAIKVFTDVRSGRSMERPGLDALLAFARDGDALAVVRLDRLGRSLGELLATVALLNQVRQGQLPLCCRPRGWTLLNR